CHLRRRRNRHRRGSRRARIAADLSRARSGPPRRARQQGNARDCRRTDDQRRRGERHDEVKRLILTASGGPFRTASREEIENATPAQALKHPTWNMGAKITIDSATLMNKGLEVIEARWLCGRSADEISIIVHPQSVVHSMIEMIDGSV